MGFFKRKKPFSLDTKGEEVVGMLEELIAKAKKHKGDPFYQYRKKKILPEKFEYGMNCFLDRITESQGIEIAQVSYQEFKKKGRLILYKDATSTDVAGIPVLFGVYGKLVEIIEEHNIANFLKPEKEIESLSDTPTFLQKNNNETESEYLYRLAATSVALLARAELFHEKRKNLEARRLLLNVQLINKIIALNPLSERKTFGGRDDYLLCLLLGTMIPDRQSEITEFLSLIGPNFWNVLFLAKLVSALYCYDELLCQAFDAEPFNFIALRQENLSQKLIKRIRELGPMETDNTFDQIWQEIEANNPNPLSEGLLSSIQIANILVGMALFYDEDFGARRERFLTNVRYHLKGLKFEKVHEIGQGYEMLGPAYKELCRNLYRKLDLSEQLDEMLKKMESPLKKRIKNSPSR